MKALKVYENINFERTNDPFKNLKIGVFSNTILEIKEFLNSSILSYDFPIEDMVLEEIVRFLLDKGYKQEKIVKVFSRDYIRRMYKGFFKFKDFKRFYDNDMLGIQEFLEGKIDDISQYPEYTRKKEINKIHNSFKK